MTTTLILGLGAACAAMTVAVALGGVLTASSARGMRASTTRLGSALGFEQLVPEQGRRPAWYGGQAPSGDRSAAICHLVLQGGRSTTDSRTEYVPSMRLAVEVAADLPGVTIYRSHNVEDRHTASFDDAFTTREGAERLSPEARDAMLAFARAYGALRLQAREELNPVTWPVGVFDDAPTVLVHDAFGVKHPVDDVRARLDALVGIARTLEPR